MTLALLPRMLERGSGTIVNVGSVGGRLGIRRESAYSGAKFALTGWTEALALDLWDTPVKVKLVSPGAVDTEIWTHPDVEPTTYDGDKASPELVAAEMAAFLDDDRFEAFPPAEQAMDAIVRAKATDVDAFLRGTAEWERAHRGDA